MALTRLGPNNSTNISGINLTSQVTGTLPTANGGTGATSFAAGKVLQSVNVYISSGDKTTTSSTFSDLSGVSLSITPSATSSKVLLMLSTNMYQNTDEAYWNLRWERDIGGTSTTFGSGTYGLAHARAAQAHDFWGGVGMTYLDSPSTTSAITYTVQIASSNGTASFGVNNTPSSIFAYEIGA
jgi:hypothetical protein